MKKNKLYPVLLFLIAVTLSLSAVTLSRFSTAVEEHSGVSVAKPVISYAPVSASFNGTPITDLSNGISVTNATAGAVLIYNFDVKNYQGLSINQVLLKYRINVEFDPDEASLPLTSTLTPSGSYPSAGSGWTYMGSGGQIVHSYTLRVTWDAAQDSPDYGNKQQNIRIVINSEQADQSS